MFTPTRSWAAISFAAALVVTSGSAQASSTASSPGCQNQSNSPIVVHRALPSKVEAVAPAARAVVVVQLARTGHVRAIALGRSSGSPDFDRAALAAAKASSFAPAAQRCVALDATFRYVVARDDAGKLSAVILPNE